MAAQQSRKAARSKIAEIRKIERDVKELNGVIHSRNGSKPPVKPRKQ